MSEEEATFPRPARTTTDVGCSCLFIGVVGGMVALSVAAFFQGDVKRLTHGRDYHGSLCGIDAVVKDKPFLYYCGAPSPTGWQGAFPKHLNFKSMSCVSECPQNESMKVGCLLHANVEPQMLPGATSNNITYVSTLDVEVTQSVAYQRSYPTEIHLGSYCVPNRTLNYNLYSKVVEGPLKAVSQFNGAVSSIMSAWLVILGAAVLAAVLGFVFLHLLKSYAGLILYITLWIGTIMTFFISLYFLVGIFFDPVNETGLYQKSSPIFYLCVGAECRFMSAIVGLVVLAIAVCMLFQTLNENIDESIGVIAAAVDCILGDGSGLTFKLQPILQALGATVLICALCIGFAFIASVTRIEHNLMSMNGVYVQDQTFAKSLEAKEVRDWYWAIALKFYFFGAIWLMLTFVSICQYVISYVVCEWFFVESEMVDNPHNSALSEPLKQAIQNRGKRVDGVRVKGVDKVQGTRAGYIERGPNGKVLVVPLGEKGPGGRDFIRFDEKVTHKSLPFLAVQRGIMSCLFHHLGTVAMGSLFSLITSPFRGLSEMIKAFMGSPSRGDLQSGFDEDDRTTRGLILAGMGLLTIFLDEVFGRYSKNMYIDVVLRSSSFSVASADAHDFIADSGGAIALLHGSMGTYEVVGVVFITAICTVASSVALTSIPAYNDEKSAYFVSNPAIMTVLAGALSMLISAAFMSLFNMAADSLLYVFAWARQEHAGHMRKYTPSPMMHLLGRELEEKPALALQANARGRFTRFSHAATKYKDVVMSTMARGKTSPSEERPLLSGGLSTFR